MREASGTRDLQGQTRADLLKKVAGRARRLVPREELPFNPARFIELYYAQAQPEELARDPATLAAAALSHLNLAAARDPGVPKIRVFNPTLERDGWTSDRTIVQMVNDDMPFLVDSSTMALRALGHAIHATVHPILRLERSGAGQLTAVDGRKAGAGKKESLIHIEITREAQPEVLARIEAALDRTLRDVRAAVTDWGAMVEKLRDATARLRASKTGPQAAREETVAFLEWLAADNFTFLGYGEYELLRGPKADTLKMKPGTGLGLLRGNAHPRLTATVELAGRARAEARAPTPIVVTKENTKSTVHRPALLDHIGVKLFDEAGKPSAELRFIGLFTSVAYSENPRDIPLLRRKIAAVIARSGLDPGGHRGKTLQHILDTYPRDDLFQSSVEDLAATSAGILRLQDRHKVRLFCRREAFGRFYSCLIYVPRDQYSVQARLRIEQLLREALAGSTADSEIILSESPLARLVVTVMTDPQRATEPDFAELERRIEEAARTWSDRFRSELMSSLPEDRAIELFRRFAGHFSAAYQEDVDPTRAREDVLKVARVHAGTSELEMTLAASSSGRTDRLRFTTFKAMQPLELHASLPILEHMGFKLVSARVYAVRVPDKSVFVQDFELESPAAASLDVAADAERLQECFVRVLRGDVENDGFNSFVASPGLTWRQAVLLRAYCKYILQIGLPFSQAYILSVLARFPRFCLALIEQFDAAFDPDLGAKDRREIEARSSETIAGELDRTVSLDDDRILRTFASVVGATLRTSYFRHDGSGAEPYLSFKLASSRISELPRPRPLFEIFVYSQRVEGVHLRCGRIARGGIRWSDRREDFRTEVLGLMKAQQVKNTVIVPNGAKGGFFCKQLPAGDRDAVQREVVRCYTTFIRGLLDLTDNLTDGKPQRPHRVIARDDPDPYLVVAADKGTATFSDIANGLAAEYEFWLGDAFASGGSAGYDHKKMGITARGGWEAVKRHFRELGVDVRREPLTVVGIGDMSGDVFGNGMLMSPQIRLVAAFDHRHVFIDPDPDPAASFAERERLFGLPRSTWDDYDRSRLSRGGGVFSRQSKTIELSREARTLLDLEQASVTPPELIRAVLKARVDLLWNGGIGTYVKGSGQSHVEAGDPPNDHLRVDGRELRCRVVGEGGNLGLTQLGRVEYALAGGRVNTDFIDNSGGVDSSDREVNIKILLGAAIEQRKLTLPKRDALLAEMTEEVAALVLASNYGQTQALSMMASRAGERLGEHMRLIRLLETQGLLDRTLEFLPSDEQVEERRAAGRGLTRPELAIVLSYSKIELRSSLIDSDVPEDPYLAGELEAYFPRRLAKRFKPLIREHRLAREIVSMLVASSIVNRMGPFFVLRTEEETGADVTQVARAYAIVREVFDVRRLWRSIEGLDYDVAAAAQYECIFQISRMVRRAVYWFLQNYADALEIEPAIARFRPGAEEVRSALPRVVTGGVERRFEQHFAAYERMGIPPPLARKIASLALMTQTLDVIELAREFKLPVVDVGRLYFELAERLRLDWVREQIETLQVEGRWRSMARASLFETVAQQLRALVRSVLRRRAGRPPAEALSAWLERSKHDVALVQRSLDDMQSAGAQDFATLSVALKELGRLT